MALKFVHERPHTMVKRKEKKQMILTAATECFSHMGYDKTTLDDIGEKVKLNKASLYYYYNSKEDLFCDVVYTEAQRFREETRSMLRTFRTAEEKVVYFLSERTLFYKRIRNLQELTDEVVKKVEPIFSTLRDGIYAEEKNLLKDVLEEGIYRGEINRTDSGKLSDVLLKVASAFRLPAKTDGGTGDQTALDDIRFTTRLILRGIRG